MERSDWQDRARGLGIILVVFGHVMRGLNAAGIMPDDAATQGMDYTLYTFHMPLFFLLAGLNVEASLARGQSRFFKNRIWTLLWPYVLWSLLQGSIQVMLGSSLNTPMTWHDVANIWRLPYAQFWFLYALMLCHLAVLAVGTRLIVLGCVAVVGCLASPYLPFMPQKFLFNLPFYVAGIWAARHLSMLNMDWRTGAVAGAGFVAFASLNYAAGGTFESPGVVPASFCGIVLVIVAVKSVGQWLGLVLASLGAMSMTIYILHILAVGGTRVMLSKLGVPHIPLVYLAGGMVCGVALPVAAHMILNRFGLLPWLGLGRFPAPVVRTHPSAEYAAPAVHQ